VDLPLSATLFDLIYRFVAALMVSTRGATMATTHHEHATHDDGAVHSHISSIPFYIGVFLCLLALTALTVGQSYVDLGRLNILLVVLIATMKASLVVLFFMHLRWDNKFHALILIATLFFIGIFFAYTMNDTDRRGELDADQNVPVLQKTGETAPGGMPSSLPATAAPAGGGSHH
jgi:cytochrome c oxidase subunit IV